MKMFSLTRRSIILDGVTIKKIKEPKTSFVSETVIYPPDDYFTITKYNMWPTKIQIWGILLKEHFPLLNKWKEKIRMGDIYQDQYNSLKIKAINISTTGQRIMSSSPVFISLNQSPEPKLEVVYKNEVCITITGIPVKERYY